MARRQEAQPRVGLARALEAKRESLRPLPSQADAAELITDLARRRGLKTRAGKPLTLTHSGWRNWVKPRPLTANSGVDEIWYPVIAEFLGVPTPGDVANIRWGVQTNSGMKRLANDIERVTSKGDVPADEAYIDEHEIRALLTEAVDCLKTFDEVNGTNAQLVEQMRIVNAALERMDRASKERDAKVAELADTVAKMMEQVSASELVVQRVKDAFAKITDEVPGRGHSARRPGGQTTARASSSAGV